jgi:hypothetical protein
MVEVGRINVWETRLIKRQDRKWGGFAPWTKGKSVELRLQST